MILTAVHTVHIGTTPQEILPGQVFEINDADGAMLLRIGSAAEPSEDELKLARLTGAISPEPAAKASRRAAKAEEPEV